MAGGRTLAVQAPHGRRAWFGGVVGTADNYPGVWMDLWCSRQFWDLHGCTPLYLRRTHTTLPRTLPCTPRCLFTCATHRARTRTPLRVTRACCRAHTRATRTAPHARAAACHCRLCARALHVCLPAARTTHTARTHAAFCLHYAPRTLHARASHTARFALHTRTRALHARFAARLHAPRCAPPTPHPPPPPHPTPHPTPPTHLDLSTNSCLEDTARQDCCAIGSVVCDRPFGQDRTCWTAWLDRYNDNITFGDNGICGVVTAGRWSIKRFLLSRLNICFHRCTW